MQEVKRYICASVMSVVVNKNMSRTSSGKGWAGRWSALLMILAILAITGFQGYWLKNNYEREKENLDITTSSSFRQTILQVQASKLKLDRLAMKMDTVTVKATGTATAARKSGKRVFNRPAPSQQPSEAAITMLNLIEKKIQDSLGITDSGKVRSMIIKSSNSSNRSVFVIDTGKLIKSDMRVSLRSSAGLPHLLDSLIKPENIERVQVRNTPDKPGDNTIVIDYRESLSPGAKKSMLDSIRALTKRQIQSAIHHKAIPDTGGSGNIFITAKPNEPGQERNNAVYRFLYNVDSIYVQDSVTVKEVTEAYGLRLKEDNIDLPFVVNKLDSTAPRSPNAVTIGFTNPVTFDLALPNTLGYMLGKLKLPILFSLLLITLTIASFVLLYRNMIKQKRLAELKNDLISNISHELKTPIATVGVAIEALKNFNAIDDPARTKEYLDISQNELQRLNLLVDKVLKLSIFEKKEIELKKERFDYKQLTAEIMNSMKLQFEKYRAKVSLNTEGESFYVDADKLHITSVVYNLLDNALKYGKENPEINVRLRSTDEHIELQVQDNGIGIPSEYKGKVFDKFFRVPTGDRHNIKGYGLGLSYVAEVVKRHKGEITVDSEAGKGSTFTVRLPKAKTPVISLDHIAESKKQTS